ncbi:lysophospholipid acyltransferase family protein [Flexithrix dorotheae]|uniref:lysophospholipid acyltransferase family protein n=1 Tax=Flexithrix dorotheae TaxID=70993 RepID=UPI00035F1DD9|nr:lysophospholipid acyltransferase family protein [Flexithrix dorotheae]
MIKFNKLPIDKKKLKVSLVKKDPFGNVLIFKRMLIAFLATVTYGRFNIVNKLKIEGTEYLEDLPKKNVLFISNHQTYYADVIALYHVFCSVKWRFKNSINLPLYMLIPRVNTYYVAAEETMKESGLIPKIFSYTGAVTVKRSWRAAGKDVKRAADRSAPEKIKKALSQGWVVNFPQGTTSPYAPIRKGTANLIKHYNPIVVPVVIDGFRRAFDKKGLFFRKRGTKLQIKFKEPLQFDENDTLDSIVQTITKAIEQDPISKAKKTEENDQN